VTQWNKHHEVWLKKLRKRRRKPPKMCTKHVVLARLQPFGLVILNSAEDHCKNWLYWVEGCGLAIGGQIVIRINHSK